MEPHQLRVITELKDLSNKVDSLSTFLSTDIFTKLDMVDQTLLEQQLALMRGYLKILKARVARF